MQHSIESRRMRRDLDKRLAQVGTESGGTMAWSATEELVLELMQDAVDRKTDMLEIYNSDDTTPKLRASLATELRLHDSHIARLTRQLPSLAGVAPPLTQAQARGRRAAMIRWHPPGSPPRSTANDG